MKRTALLIFLFSAMAIGYMMAQDADSIKIENLQTRLRIISNPIANPVEVWRANPGGIITNYADWASQKGKTCFGYVDENREILLCEVTNFPDSAKQWEGEFVYTIPLATITEINIRMSGILRISTNDATGKKLGTMELTSLESTGPEAHKPVFQPGVYLETYPNREWTKIDFIDRETVEITQAYKLNPYSYKCKYEINEQEYAIKLTGILEDITPSGPGGTLFFRLLNDSVFEIENLYASTSELAGQSYMTFERVKLQDDNGYLNAFEADSAVWTYQGGYGNDIHKVIIYGDTLIDGQNWKIVTGEPYISILLTRTENQKVYVRDYDLNCPVLRDTLFLVYDFSLDAGDSIELMPFIEFYTKVVEIDSVVLNKCCKAEIIEPKQLSLPADCRKAFTS